MKLFQPESRFMIILEHTLEMFYVGILWLVFSLPVITAGAAYCAAYHTMVKTVRGGRGYVFREFLSTFKADFGQSTAIWLIYAGCSVMIAIDRRIFGAYRDSLIAFVIVVILFIIMTAISVITVYALSYAARFDQKTGLIIRNAVLMSLRHFFHSLLMAVLLIGAVYMVYRHIILAAILPGPLIMALSVILENIFCKYMNIE